jgi:hypothetical protein
MGFSNKADARPRPFPAGCIKDMTISGPGLGLS